MDAIYVPANGQQFEGYWQRQPDLLYKDTWDFRTFTEKSFVNHKYSLTNAYYNVERGNLDVRKAFGYPQDVNILGDSGGFQVASFQKKSKEIKITPIDILHWLENNATIGMNLDIPVVDDFRTSLRLSQENFSLFETHRQNYSFKLYNILHGRNLREIETWYNAVKDFQFDGWAIGIKPSDNVFLQVLGYLVLHEKDATNLSGSCHFFGMSSLQNMIALSMLANHFGTDLTFDSSSFNMGSRFRAYYLPHSVRNFVSFGRDKSQLMTELPCSCPVCKNSSIQEMYDQELFYTPLLISLHNLYQFLEVNKSINVIAKDPEILMEFANSLGETELVKNLTKVLDTYERLGYAKTYENFGSDKNLFMVDADSTCFARNLAGIK